MINFLKYRFVYFALSFVILIPGIYSLLRWGLNPSVDFSGGTVIKIQAEGLTSQMVEKALQEKQIDFERVTQEKNGILVRAKPIERSVWDQVQKSLETTLKPSQQEIKDATESAQKETLPVEVSSITILRFDSVGPVLGKELLEKTLIAAFIAMMCILLYVAWAFKNVVFGVSAVVALIHDLLVVLGIFSLLGHFYGVEVDLLFVTALLTTMSFSVHDTIVVFDRIRESLKKDGLPLETTINKSLSETMVRSLNNSMTIVFMLLALLLMGGETIRYFSLALLIGTISGTYSSPFVATPVLYQLLKRRKK